MQFFLEERSLKRDPFDNTEDSINLIEAAFDVILEGYLRIGQRAPFHFNFEMSRFETLRERKERLITRYQEMARKRHMDRMALLRHMRHDIREQLNHAQATEDG